MNSLAPSPTMAFYITDRIDNMETYQEIQSKKESGFRLKGSMILPDGRTHLIFYRVKDRQNYIICLAFRNARARSFSSHQ